MSFNPYYSYFQAAASISGLLFFRSVKLAGLGWFLLLCVAGFVIDIGSLWWVIGLGFPNNYPIINLYSVVALTLLLIGFYKPLMLSPNEAKWYKRIAAFLIITVIIDYILTVGADKNSILGNLGFNFFGIILSCTWLFKLAIKDEVFSFFDEPLFWIASGFLIFCLGALVVMGMSQYIRIHQITIQNKPLYRVIMPMLNVILYSSFTYAFILCRLKRKSYSLS